MWRSHFPRTERPTEPVHSGTAAGRAGPVVSSDKAHHAPQGDEVEGTEALDSTLNSAIEKRKPLQTET